MKPLPQKPRFTETHPIAGDSTAPPALPVAPDLACRSGHYFFVGRRHPQGPNAQRRPQQMDTRRAADVKVSPYVCNGHGAIWFGLFACKYIACSLHHPSQAPMYRTWDGVGAKYGALTVCVCLFRSYVFVFHTQAHMETQQELVQSPGPRSAFWTIISFLVIRGL